jgi:hypothetical protein
VQPTCLNCTEEAEREGISLVHEVVALPTKGCRFGKVCMKETEIECQ